MATTDFIPFAIAGGAPVLSQAEYAALPPQNGYGPGIFPKERFNKAMRQSSVMAAALALFINSQGRDALDNGDVPGLSANLLAAIAAVSGAVASPPVFAAAYATTANPLAPPNLTLTAFLNLGVGTWMVDADAGAFCQRFWAQNLSIDGVIVQSIPRFEEFDGVSMTPMGGVRSVVVSGAPRSVAITYNQESGGTNWPYFIKATGIRIA